MVTHTTKSHSSDGHTGHKVILFWWSQVPQSDIRVLVTQDTKTYSSEGHSYQKIILVWWSHIPQSHTRLMVTQVTKSHSSDGHTYHIVRKRRRRVAWRYPCCSRTSWPAWDTACQSLDTCAPESALWKTTSYFKYWWLKTQLFYTKTTTCYSTYHYGPVV